MSTTTTNSPKTGNTTIRNNALFCLNCGCSEPLQFPMSTAEFSGKINSFNNNHKDCEKTWQEPVVNMDLSLEERALWWAENGERGTSSESIFSFMTGRYRQGFAAGHYPHDLDDFRRCYALLQVVPEWKARMKEMKIVNNTWSKLAENWDKLTEMYEAAKASGTGKAEEMYQFMKSLGC